MVGRVLRCLVVGVGLALAPSAAAATQLHPTRLATASYGAAPVGFARSADGTLHVVTETNINWGDSANGIGAASISPSGHVEPFVQALAWPGSGGSPSGIPGVAVLPTGVLDAVVPGSPGGDPGPWEISSSNGGASWSGPIDVGSGSMEGGGATTLQAPGGKPVLTEGCCGGLVVQQGFGPGSPTDEVVNSSDGVAGNVDTAVDAATGAVVASWDSAQAPGGLWFQQVAPTLGAAQHLPIPSQYGEGQPAIVAGRDIGAGVFAAYPADFANTTHIRLQRYGGGSVAVGSVKNLHADAWGAATGNDGRIWVMWSGTVNGQGITAVTRSNKLATRFEPIQRYDVNWSGGITMSGDGRLGPLDMLISGTPAVKTGQAQNGIYYARILPVLSATVTVKKHGKDKFALTVRVTDAGDAVAGALARAKGHKKHTGTTGAAKLVVPGHRGRRVTVTVSAATYQVLRVKVKL